MREIKYRGMDLEGRWFYGLPCIIKDGRDKGTYISNKAGVPKAYDIRPETLSQFTGLLDKQGVEIYEGDIVKTQVWTKINEGNSSGDWYIGEILFSNGCFYGHFPKPEVMEYLQFFRYEVIGNIYENLEVLND